MSEYPRNLTDRELAEHIEEECRASAGFYRDGFMDEHAAAEKRVDVLFAEHDRRETQRTHHHH